MVGKSTCGSGATGKRPQSPMPSRSRPAASSDVPMGRWMKLDEMLIGLCGSRRRTRSVGSVAGARTLDHLDAGPELVLSVHDDTLAARQPLGHDAGAAFALPNLDRLHGHGVVRLYDVNVEALL